MNKLQGKDLINVGIFTAIYFVVMMAIAMLGFIPIFLPLLIVLVPLVGGIVMMLYYSKVQKFGMVSLTGLICGILMLLTGMGYWSIITGAVFGVLADLVLKSGDYKSAKKGIISHGVFSMWIIGNYIPIVATRDSYYQQLISGYGQEYADSIMSYISLLTEKSWKGSVIYFVLYGGSYILQLWALPHLSGLPNFLVVAICGFFMRFVPGIMMGYITVRTTTVSEFVASMKKLHLPEQIIIPMSVIFRFFPTVVEEYNAIGDAMKMRGIRFGGGKASAMLEYRLVPVIMCSVKIGEELNAAALTRGLGGPVKRTNICEIGFHVQDVFFLLLCVVAFAIPIVTMITGR